MKTICKIVLPGLIILMTGCSNSSTTSGGQDISSTGIANIQINNVTTLPTANYTLGEYSFVTISNHSDKNITLQNTKIRANSKILASSVTKAYIDLGQCLQIKANSTCNAKIFTNPSYQSYLLTLTYTDTSGAVYDVNQVISFNALLPVQNGFIYDATQLSINNSGLTIPFRLNSNYANISVLINNQPAQFSCYKNNYKPNNLCSVNIQSNSIKNSSGIINKLEIIGYDNNGTIINKAILVLTNNQVANIITSGQNVVINPDNGTSPQTVYLVNNGLTTATGLSITPQTPVTISSNTCTTTLNTNANCSFIINVTGSPTSGQGSVAISYSNGQNTQLLYFNVSYINQSTPGLTLTSSGSFNNVTESTGPAYISVNVTNTGSINFTNLQFSNLNLQKSDMATGAVPSSCQNGNNLTTGQNCIMLLSYTPFIIESGTVNFIPTANYLGPASESLTYANSILNLSYSSIGTTQSFVAVGDLGTVFSSTSNPPTTWTINESSPFSTPTESANGMVINGNTYAITTSSGRVVYSTLNGLFWQQSGTTNLNASTCGILFDGAKYYTCGNGATNSGVCASGSGCIINSNNLASPWTMINGSQTNGNQYTNIFYFAFSTNIAYIATVTKPFANGSNALMISTDGTSFSPVAMGLTPNVITTVSVMNTNTGLLTAWSDNGFASSQNISSATSNWNANSSVSPQPTYVNNAVFANNLYTVGTALGNIYTKTDPTTSTAYAQVYSGSTTINGMGFLSNEYLAVGGNGLVIESFAGSTWGTQAIFTIGQNTAANLFDVYIESTPQNLLWATGVSALAYTPVAATPSWTTPGLRSIAKYINGSTITYLAIDNQGFIYTSSNLATWTQESNPSGQILNAIYCNSNSLCLAAGNNGAIIQSTDGLTWSQLPSPTTANLNGITCQLNTCVIVGGTGSTNSGTALISNNSNTWTIGSSSLATTALNSVTYFFGQFVAVGNSGAIFTSTNGINWSQKTSTTANNLNSIDCGASNCVAVGNSGTIIFSGNNNITSWSTAISGTINDLNSVTNNGIYMAVGKAGTMRYSTTGSGSWTTATFPSTITTTNLWEVISK